VPLAVAVVIAALVVGCGHPAREQGATPSPQGSSTPPAPPPPPLQQARPVVTSIVTPPSTRTDPTSFSVTVSGHGRPVIFLPGLGCPGSVWDDTVAHFAGSIEAHVVTLAGFAGRPPIAAPLLITARDELAAYIRANKLDRPVIVGHSLGGFLAFWLAATAPDVVGKLVIVDAAPVVFGDISPPGTTNTDAWRTASEGELASKIRDMFSQMATNTAKLAPVVNEVIKSDKRTFADALDLMMTTDIRPSLPNIRAPMLVVMSDDRDYVDAVTRQLAGLGPHTIVSLPGTKHFVFFDDPTGFYRALDGFLGR